MRPGVVLPREADAWAESEVTLLPAQAPGDVPCRGVDLVDRPRVSSRDEQLAVGREVDGVEVNRVVGRVLRIRLVRFAEGDVSRTAPLEHQVPCGQVNTLDCGVEGRPAGGPPDAA